MGQGNDTLNDSRTVTTGEHLLHESATRLQRLDGQITESAQVRETGAEIIDSHMQLS